MSSDHELDSCGDTAADATLVLQAALAEYQSLRAEIQDRSGHAWTMVNLNITATAAILGFVLSDKADPRILLAIPLIAPALGMLFVDHSVNIHNFGWQIDHRLRPIIAAATGSNALLTHEQLTAQYERRRVLRWIPFGIPILIMFAGAPVAALAFVIPQMNGWDWLLWTTGLVFVASETALLVAFLRKPDWFQPR